MYRSRRSWRAVGRAVALLCLWVVLAGSAAQGAGPEQKVAGAPEGGALQSASPQEMGPMEVLNVLTVRATTRSTTAGNVGVAVGILDQRPRGAFVRRPRRRVSPRPRKPRPKR
ncbi:MAG: hypothetical protein QJR13_01665, partial [Bacillota bacterium]|nr:hypothetical protein [Bacillota bacterium]